MEIQSEFLVKDKNFGTIFLDKCIEKKMIS